MANLRSPADTATTLDRVASCMTSAAGPLHTAYLNRDCSFVVAFDAGEAGTRTVSAGAPGWGRVTVSEGMMRPLEN